MVGDETARHAHLRAPEEIDTFADHIERASAVCRISTRFEVCDHHSVVEKIDTQEAFPVFPA